jgi:hypothetical protein
MNKEENKPERSGIQRIINRHIKPLLPEEIKKGST